MKIAVVAYINFFDNDLRQEAVIVKDKATWKDALFKSSFVDEHSLTEVPDDENEAKQYFFDCDSMFSIVFLKDETLKTYT